MNVLIACEESQEVCKAFRQKGHNAFSCDLVPCSGGHPEWHIMGDALEIINGFCLFKTQSGEEHVLYRRWDLIIAHPPCTYLCVSGNRWFNVDRYGSKAVDRMVKRVYAEDFFMKFINADCKRICVENPIGIMSTMYRRPDQIIQPYHFGHPYTKSTCLWLKGLDKLHHTNVLEKPSGGWVNQSITASGRYGGFKAFNSSNTRSKTFPGIAQAMADQWG